MPKPSEMPKHGITVFAHVDHSLTEALQALSTVAVAIRTQKRLTKAKRTDLWRQLAGVVSDVESVRVWLDGGAPRR